MPLQLPGRAPSPSTGPAATARWPSTSATSARCGSTGPDALDRLQRALTNDLGKIAPGRAQYTHLLDEADASVLDDIIVWWVDDETLRRDAQRLQHRSGHRRAAGRRAADVDVTAARAIIAVQGPEARARLAAVSPEAAAVGRFRVAPVDWHGVDRAPWPAPATPARTASSARCRPSRAGAFWEAVLDAGVVPAGLGARDTLRLEAGLPLHGHELGPGITPLQAGLGWVVSWDKGDVPGPGRPGGRDGAGRRPAPARPRRRGPPTAPGRSGGAGRRRSRSAWSPAATSHPSSGHGIALAFVPPDVRIGDHGGHRPAGRAAARWSRPFVRHRASPIRPGPRRRLEARRAGAEEVAVAVGAVDATDRREVLGRPAAPATGKAASSRV